MRECRRHPAGECCQCWTLYVSRKVAIELTVRRPRLMVPTNLQAVTVADMLGAVVEWSCSANALCYCREL